MRYTYFLLLFSLLLSVSCSNTTSHTIKISCIPEFSVDPSKGAHQSLIDREGPFLKMVLRDELNQEITMHLFVDRYSLKKNTFYSFTIRHDAAKTVNDEIHVSERIMSISDGENIIYAQKTGFGSRRSWLPYGKERYYKKYNWLYDSAHQK